MGKPDSASGKSGTEPKCDGESLVENFTGSVSVPICVSYLSLALQTASQTVEGAIHMPVWLSLGPIGTV